MVANDPVDADSTCSNFDTITLTFDIPINTPVLCSDTSACTLSEINAVCTFNVSLGTAYSGAYNDAGNILVINVADVSGDGGLKDYVANNFSVSVKASGNVQNPLMNSLSPCNTSGIL